MSPPPRAGLAATCVITALDTGRAARWMVLACPVDRRSPGMCGPKTNTDSEAYSGQGVDRLARTSRRREPVEKLSSPPTAHSCLCLFCAVGVRNTATHDSRRGKASARARFVVSASRGCCLHAGRPPSNSERQELTEQLKAPVPIAVHT